MTRDEAIRLLRGGAKDIVRWNEWRAGPNRSATPSLENASLGLAVAVNADLGDVNLSGADLRGANLHGANLQTADLRDAVLSRASFMKADLRRANLGGSRLCGAVLCEADLRGAYLREADLDEANLSAACLNEADLRGANLLRADMKHTYLVGTALNGADLSGATFLGTILNSDVRETKGLESVDHWGPSDLSLQAIRDWNHSLPEKFLRGCRLSPAEVIQARMLNPRLNAEEMTDLWYKAFDLRTRGPMFIGGVFISYSHEDSKFVDKVYDELMDQGANVWLDQHDMVAGDMQKQVARALRLNDIVLLVLSESSVVSDWVEHELDIARKKERDEKRDVLCPVALDDSWKAKVDGDVLWRQLKKKNVLDFSKWKTEAFEGQFKKLLTGMKIYYPPKEKAER